MRKIRKGVFETNSSSVHTLTVCTEEEYERYCRGDAVILTWNSVVKGTKYEGRKFFTMDEAREIERNYAKAHDLDTSEENIEFAVRDDFICADDESDYLEWYDHHFTTPSGDKMVVFGQYGYDG